jgi:tellurite methyltransferase
MKYARVAERYDKEFAGDFAGWFSTGPMPLVERLARFFISAGDVLEIGAGVGQNSIYLASRGFKVTAMDISSVAIERIKAQAKLDNLALQTEVADITEKQLEKEFDVIICTGVLHHLLREDAVSVIQKIQRGTKPHGFNIVATFTKEGDIADARASPYFYVDSNKDLESFYSNWTNHVSFQKEGKLHEKNAKGENVFHVFAGLLSQKT